VVRKEAIRQSPGLMEASEILFGDEAQAKIDEYFEVREKQDAASQELVDTSPDRGERRLAAQVDNEAQSEALR